MGVQQASLDFFNTPPEVQKPVEKQAVPHQEFSPPKNPEARNEPLTPAATKEPQTPDSVPEKLPEPEPTINQPVFRHEPAPAIIEVPEPGLEKELLVVDEEVREMEFVIKEKKTVVVNTGKKSTRGRMKLSEMDVLVDLVDVPDDEVLFQKRYYNIGAVSEMFKVNISLIRFWENEFDILKPKKNGKGDRLFRPEDVKNLQLIYHLLREKKYTIDGAKDFLKKNKKAEDSFAVIDSLKKIRSFLLELKSNL